MKRSTYIIYSRQLMGFDYRIWAVLFCVLLVSGVLFGFKISTHTTCSEITLQTKGVMTHNNPNVFFINEGIIFSAAMQYAQEITWDFGDGSSVVTGASVTHSYINEGGYMVTVTINDECKESYRISIRKMATLMNKTADSTGNNVITGNGVVNAGTLETFNCSLPASYYRWTMEGDPLFGTKTGNPVSYSFSATGNYTIVVQLDNDDSKIWKKAIKVVKPGAQGDTIKNTQYDLPDVPLPPIIKKDNAVQKEAEHQPQNMPAAETKPAESKPAPKKYKQIPDPEFQSMLNQVVSGTLNVPDFDNFLCKGGDTQVQANGNLTNFAGLCKTLRMKKGLFNRLKAKIKSVKQVRDPDQNNCVLMLYVDFNW